MNKITVAVVTACVLFGLSLQLPAPPHVFEINIDVKDVNGARKIDMGENYACVVPPGATIKWTCEFDFLLEFQADAPFDPDLSDEAQVPSKKMIKKKARDNAKHNQLYKYTVFVVDGGNNNKPLSLDPIIVIIPPRG